MIEFKNVSCTYPGGITALDGINIKMSANERIALLGLNGAGKSTLMKALVGLVDFTGEIVFDGTPVVKKTLPEIRKKVGYVLQNPDNQLFMPTVRDDMIFGALNYGMSREEANALAEKTLEKLGNPSLADRRNHTLSGGEKKLAAVATVLMTSPEFILFDEPVASLDAMAKKTLISAIESLEGGFVIATHDLQLAGKTCDRVIVLEKGKPVFDGPSTEVLCDNNLLEKFHLI